MIIRLGLTALLALACYANPVLITAETEEPVEYMLGMPVENIDYTVKLFITTENIKKKNFTGKVAVDFSITKSLAAIRIHSDNAVEKDKIKIKQDADLTIDKTEFNVLTKILTITLSKNLETSKKVHLEIEYEGKLYDDDMHGFYISKYKSSKDAKEEVILTTQFQPTHARRAFPCFDEPAYKATFTISITYPKEYKTVLANQELDGKVITSGVSSVSTFKKTPRMSTYLVAFVVSSFESVETTQNHKIYAAKHLITSADYSKLVTDGILEALNEYTGVKYGSILDNHDPQNPVAFKKLDQVAIPDFSAGAMENWGLVTYREAVLLWDEDHSKRRDKQRIASVIAHEFAHMWFGNLVTLTWWDNTWLNEGFARFFEYHGVAKAPAGADWDMENQFVIEQQQTVFSVDGTDTTKPLNSDARSPGEVKTKFGTISYNKGACVIRMIRNYMGEDKFKKALKTYLTKNQYKNVVPDDLFVEFGHNSENTEPGDIMKAWVKNPGYPVVNVTLIGDNKIKFTQDRFTYANNQHHSQRWDIPITYSSNQATPESVLFHAGENFITVDVKKDEVFFANIDNAYYRVNYDQPLLDRIIKALSTEASRKKIQPINRAQIIDDVMNLARAGLIQYDKAFDVLGYLKDEINYYPWYSALTAFSYLRRRLPEDTLKSAISEYMKNQMENYYEKAKSFKIEPEDDQIQVYAKVLALQWACELNNEKCKTKALTTFEESMVDNAATVDANLQPVVYCAAARHDTKDNKNWNHLLKLFKESEVAAEKVTILTALGCSTNKETLKKYLEMSIDSKSGIRTQDAYTAFTAVLTGNPEGVDIAFEFLQNNFKDIKDAYGEMNAVQTIVAVLADRLTTDVQGDKLKKFMDDNRKHIESDEIIRFAKENIDANRAWVKKNSESLTRLFIKDSGDSDSDKDKNAASTVVTSSLLIVAIACLRQLL